MSCLLNGFITIRMDETISGYKSVILSANLNNEYQQCSGLDVDSITFSCQIMGVSVSIKGSIIFGMTHMYDFNDSGIH